MNRTRFTRSEAEKLVGTHVKTRADLSDVPAGTLGEIDGWQETERSDTYDVIVRFEPSLTTKPVLKWLSKSDYQTLLKEVQTDDQ
jgi:hypothetical protein